MKLSFINNFKTYQVFVNNTTLYLSCEWSYLHFYVVYVVEHIKTCQFLDWQMGAKTKWNTRTLGRDIIVFLVSLKIQRFTYFLFFLQSRQATKKQIATSPNTAGMAIWNCKTNKTYNRILSKTRQSKGRLYLPPLFLEHFVFLLTWLVRWTWPKFYTTTGQEWENRKYKLFDW